MVQDADVARVATALGAPGIRYRSFGNEPVRPRSAPMDAGTGTFPPPPAALDQAAGACGLSIALPPGPPTGSEPLPASAAPLLTEAVALEPMPQAARFGLLESLGRPAEPVIPPLSPAPAAAVCYGLLESLGHRASPPAAPPTPAPAMPNGTLGLLLARTAPTPMPTPLSPSPPTWSTALRAAPLPAASVTLPLAELLRLVAATSR